MSSHSTTPKIFFQNKKILIGTAIFLVTFVALIIAASIFHWDWVGLSNIRTTTIATEVTQSAQRKVTTTETIQPGKTLWDWLQLLGVLAIPVVVGFGTAFFTREQAKTSEANAENQQQEEQLRAYIDKLSELLLNKELSTNPNMQSIVRARTLAALHILTTERKAIVLRFLHDSNLLQYVKGFLYLLDLSNTDLKRIDLHEADLSGTDLHGANLSGTDLHGADLRNVNLSGASLNRAVLQGAKLADANLQGADLMDANLQGAILLVADLCEANLQGADLSGANLHSAKLRRTSLAAAKLHEADVSNADLFEADMSAVAITLEQLEKARNVSPVVFELRKPAQSAASQEVKTTQLSTTSGPLEIQLDQTNQEVVQQQEY